MVLLIELNPKKDASDLLNRLYSDQLKDLRYLFYLIPIERLEKIEKIYFLTKEQKFIPYNSCRLTEIDNENKKDEKLRKNINRLLYEAKPIIPTTKSIKELELELYSKELSFFSSFYFDKLKSLSKKFSGCEYFLTYKGMNHDLYIIKNKDEFEKLKIDNFPDYLQIIEKADIQARKKAISEELINENEFPEAELGYSFSEIWEDSEHYQHLKKQMKSIFPPTYERLLGEQLGWYNKYRLDKVTSIIVKNGDNLLLQRYLISLGHNEQTRISKDQKNNRGKERKISSKVPTISDNKIKIGEFDLADGFPIIDHGFDMIILKSMDLISKREQSLLWNLLKIYNYEKTPKIFVYENYDSLARIILSNSKSIEIPSIEETSYTKAELFFYTLFKQNFPFDLWSLIYTGYFDEKLTFMKDLLPIEKMLDEMRFEHQAVSYFKTSFWYSLEKLYDYYHQRFVLKSVNKDLGNSIIYKGDFWEIQIAGRKEYLISDIKGMRYIAYLLKNPNIKIETDHLYEIINGKKREPLTQEVRIKLLNEGISPEIKEAKDTTQSIYKNIRLVRLQIKQIELEFGIDFLGNYLEQGFEYGYKYSECRFTPLEQGNITWDIISLPKIFPIKP
jgi:hypothetical protein